MILDIHLHVLAVKQYQAMFKEFKPYCADLIDEGNASKFLNQDVNGLSHMDEMALQVIEKGQKIIKNYKV